MPTWNSMLFTDSISPVMDKMIGFHDHILMVLTLVLVFLSYSMLITSKYLVTTLSTNHDLEVIWTCLPAALLLVIAFPSLHILYLSEESPSPLLNLKVIGNQWYWDYEYMNMYSVDGIMNVEGEFRLLDTLNYPVIPMDSLINALVSSSDVIHSWTIPSMGVKVDAVPGRINMIPLYSNRPGVFYGQCSEICGLYHSFMPITLEIVCLK